MNGLILKSDSPMGQFEITGFPHGGSITGSELPAVVWASRIAGETSCPDGNPCFSLIRETGEYKVSAARTGYEPAVCLCMGNWIE